MRTALSTKSLTCPPSTTLTGWVSIDCTGRSHDFSDDSWALRGSAAVEHDVHLVAKEALAAARALPLHGECGSVDRVPAAAPRDVRLGGVARLPVAADALVLPALAPTFLRVVSEVVGDDVQQQVKLVKRDEAQVRRPAVVLRPPALVTPPLGAPASL